MAIVTLTTDLGKNNYNIASLKGAILTSSPGCQIVDISNEISNYDIPEAVFMAGNSYKFFPKRTIHVIVVNAYYASRVRILLMEKEGYYFIAPDNGILSLLHDDIEGDEIRYMEYGLEPGDLFYAIAKFAGEVGAGKPLSEIGLEAVKINKKIGIKPVISGNIIRASVVFIDKFGNAVLNIRKEHFDKLNGNRAFELQYGPKGIINKISKKYSDVPYGDELCLFNSAGYMEIAVNMGRANELLGLEKGSIVEIKFE